VLERAGKIKKISLVDQLVMQLRKDIINSVYPSGSYLPTEIELTKHFGTSRLTVRSALQELAKEGLIEISQGRGSIVKNYWENVGLDLLPEIVLATSRKLISQGVLDDYRQHISWVYGKIYLEACRKARPSDKEKLLASIEGISDAADYEERWKIMSRFCRELLRITENIFLMMLYNSHVNFMRRLLDVYEDHDLSFDTSFYRNLSSQLIEPICNNDENKVRELFTNMNDATKYRLDGLFAWLAERL
jgi:DNA-binding FadR family transcriptional regulator